ncbi:hypothetical protein K469DRAFT_696728 [Zopfia rhizophila CBS 207.26]|uniref:Uncharacterized protein n=1 Tax=Zopfia rhizophila CBS 207.26 TaxID=1314779 RepID=A0A6A6EI16_9PEZI|nr:hypothetical protein K469DRAFT_696728 [Zopfia rhizophila CBS 207.26]
MLETEKARRDGCDILTFNNFLGRTWFPGGSGVKVGDTSLLNRFSYETVVPRRIAYISSSTFCATNFCYTQEFKGPDMASHRESTIVPTISVKILLTAFIAVHSNVGPHQNRVQLHPCQVSLKRQLYQRLLQVLHLGHSYELPKDFKPDDNHRPDIKFTPLIADKKELDFIPTEDLVQGIPELFCDFISTLLLNPNHTSKTSYLLSIKYPAY